VDVLLTISNLPKAKREVHMGAKILQRIEGVAHTLEWVSVLTRNLIKATVVNA
jgi:hypothetical protein